MPLRHRVLIMLVLAVVMSVIAWAAVETAGDGASAGVSRIQPPTRESTASFRLADAHLQVQSCDALLARYQRLGVREVTPWGWQYFGIKRVYEDAALAAVPRPQEAVSSATGTNVQEAGVDEPDIAKTDGRIAVQWHGRTLSVWDVTGAEPRRVGHLVVRHLSNAELLLAGDRVFLIGSRYRPPRHHAYRQPLTEVVDVSLADVRRPRVLTTQRYDADLLAARLTGSTVRLVLDQHLPDLPFVHPHRHLSARQALRENQRLVRRSSIRDWIGRTDCAAIGVPTTTAGLGTVKIVGFDATSPTSRSITGVATSSQLVYLSLDRLYLATRSFTFCCVPIVTTDSPMNLHAGDGRTRIYEFDLVGTAATYVAGGSVAGTLPDRWAMDEHDGVLRLALGPRKGGANSVVTVGRSGSRLVELGRLSGLGRNESIEAVRWFDDLAVVVTFRQTDPLFTVDLSDPSRPRLAGEFRLPGASTYLHPLGPNRILGVGSLFGGGHERAKMSLFGVHDLTKPHLRDSRTLRPDTYALAGGDPRQFTWLPQERTAVIVVQRGGVTRQGALAIVKVRRSHLRVRLLPMVHDGFSARTLPLPDGRALVSTGSTLRFLPLT